MERMSGATSESLQQETGPNPKAVERGFWCGVFAFVTWSAMGVESVLRPFQDNRRDTYWVLPFVLTVATFYYVHIIQRRRSRTETVGYIIVLIASALTCSAISVCSSTSRRSNPLGFLEAQWYGWSGSCASGLAR
jgi:hypothetical protein